MHPADGGADETEERIWDLTQSINVKGVWFGCKHAIQAMKKVSHQLGAESCESRVASHAQLESGLTARTRRTRPKVSVPADRLSTQRRWLLSSAPPRRSWRVSCSPALTSPPFKLTADTASKGAVLALTRELAMVHARDGIRFNSLCPCVAPRTCPTPVIPARDHRSSTAGR